MGNGTLLNAIQPAAQATLSLIQVRGWGVLRLGWPMKPTVPKDMGRDVWEEISTERGLGVCVCVGGGGGVGRARSG